MRKYTVLLIAIISPSSTDFIKSTVSVCKKHPIYCQIIKNNPTINKKYAMDLSNIIHKVTKEYEINSRKYTAILAQESMYNLGAKNFNRGVSLDLGISQINSKTALAYNLDLLRLTNDLQYSVEAGAIVLKDLKNKYSKLDQKWWTRYNSSNPNRRKTYEKNVIRYM